MITKKFVTAFATGALMLVSLTPLAFAATVNTPAATSPVNSVTTTVSGIAQNAESTIESLLGGNSINTNTTANVTSNNGNTSANVNNNTSANVLRTTTSLTTQLGL